MNAIKIVFLTMFLFPFLLAGQFAYAAPQWEYDLAHSRIGFDVTHIYSTVSGYFEEFGGTFTFNPEDLAGSKITFEIKVNSINTGIGKRDSHLRTEDFFDAKKYPLITFQSSKIVQTGGNNYDVTGTLTVKDMSKEITLPFKHLGTTAHPLKPKHHVAGFNTSLTIDRLEYNVGNGKFYKMGVVGKDVDINVSLEVLREK